MSRISVIALFLTICGCATQQQPHEFRGVPIVRGADTESEIDTIDRVNRPSVLMTSTDSRVNIGIFQARTGQPYVTMLDTDGDGVFDVLTYSSLSKSGEILVEVEDYGMDGQPDFILNRMQGTAVVFYKGTWREVEGVGSSQSPTIKVGDTEILLKDVLIQLGRGAFSQSAAAAGDR